MAFPTTSVLDDFNRADENPLSQGGSWTSVAEVGGLRVVSNQATPSANWAASYRGSWADVEVFVTLNAAGTGFESYIAARYQDAGGVSPIRDSRRRGYQMTSTDGTTYKFTRMDDGGTGATLIAATAWPGGNIANGDSMGFSSIGGTHTLYLKRGAGSWTQINSVSDSTYTNAGAIMLQGNTLTTSLFDSFGGGAAVTSEKQSFYGYRRKMVAGRR